MSNEKLTFQPYSSILNPGFWQQLTNVKLNDLKLSQEPLDIHGTYSCNLARDLPCLASFDYSSFSTQHQEPGNKFTCPLHGKLVCMNLMQEFIDLDKKAFLNTLGQEIWESIVSGAALLEPERCLSKFGLLVYADLKKYKFFYWFTYPALNYPKEVFQRQSSNNIQVSILQQNFQEHQVQQLQQQYDLPTKERTFQRGYFMVVLHHETGQLECLPLTRYYEMASGNLTNREIYFAYTDPSADPQHPGWPLRNFLTLIAVQYKLNRVKVIRIRKGATSSSSTPSSSNLNLQHCMVLDLTFELTTSEEYNTMQDCPLVTGWEKNESQQMAPKRVNLSNLLDPRRLAEDAVNLNLRLMKWRLLPGLDLERIANTKCLLLGCGTLGCHIARGLLAWGVKQISLVDNAKISYSNPVRQSLYTFDDCLDGSQKNGIFKAEAAAASLRRIHPTINVASHVFSIPMPGHHVGENELEQTRKDVARLEALIKSHDTIFLLMDTRESRWLPSVIALANQKLVINSAIGFDTFLLQRYGVRDYSLSDKQDDNDDDDDKQQEPRHSEPTTTSTSSKSARRTSYLSADQLGCYFCNDIVAPGDSTLDRTLDQQCTVSRPGVSMMVSALAVELLASVVSSRRGSLTPAAVDFSESNYDEQGANEEDDELAEQFASELGIVPHSIRGNMNRFHIYMPTSPSFNKCSACSRAVVRSYLEQGFDFLHRVFDDPSHLEEVAGLKDLQNVSDDVWALDSDEQLFDGESC